MLDFSREALRFDPSGNYVRRWLPVLSRLPSKYIHKCVRASARGQLLLFWTRRPIKT